MTWMTMRAKVSTITEGMIRFRLLTYSANFVTTYVQHPSLAVCVFIYHLHPFRTFENLA